MTVPSPVHELRLALTVDDFDQAVHFYRDSLGLPEIESWDAPEGQGAVLAAGRATIELLSPAQARHVDEVELDPDIATTRSGTSRSGGRVRVALQVDDAANTAATLTAAGADPLGALVVTPWGHHNVRLDAPDGTQLTLYTVPPTGAADTDVADLTAFVGRAVDLALDNVERGQLPFGALVIVDGEVAATGVNTALLDNDPTAHAESAAMRAAMAASDRRDLTGAIVVASAEPCPMCHATAMMLGVDRLVYAAPRTMASLYGFVLPSAAAALAAPPSAGPGSVAHLPVDAAEEPFRRHRERTSGSGVERPTRS